MKVQNVSECLILSEPQNILSPNLVLMQHLEPEHHAERKKKLFAIFKVKVTVSSDMIEM